MKELKLKGRASNLPTQGTDGWRRPSKEEEFPKSRPQGHLRRCPPQQHLASPARCGLLKGEHLEVMPVGCSVLRVDVGAGEGREFHVMEQYSAAQGNEVGTCAAAWMHQSCHIGYAASTPSCLPLPALMGIWVVATFWPL